MGPRIDPDYPSENPTLVQALADAIHKSYGTNYTEGGWQKWMVGICALLIVGGVGGAIAMYGQLTALEVRMEYIKYQVDDLKRIVVERHP